MSWYIDRYHAVSYIPRRIRLIIIVCAQMNRVKGIPKIMSDYLRDQSTNIQPSDDRTSNQSKTLWRLIKGKEIS